MKNILALKGGGYKGLYQALILNYIEKKTNKKIHEIFDLIVGTSIGSINGFALSLGITTQEILNLYLSKTGRKVFQKNILTNDIFASKYSESDIKDFIKGFFKDKQMKECLVPTMSLSYDIVKKEPKLFKSYKTPDEQIYHATKASASAPTYFPSHEYEGSLLIDGGVMFNDPSLIAYVEAQKLFKGENINLLSIGTLYDIKPIKIKNGGKLAWATNIFDVLFEATSSGIDYLIKNLALRENDNYLRIDKIDKMNLAMDNSSKEAIELIYSYAEKTIEENKDAIDNFINIVMNKNS